MLTTSQIKTAQAIVNIFETGAVRGDYSSVTLIDSDSGHLTFGRSQTTLSSGNLYTLLAMYCGNPDAQFGARLQYYLPHLQACDIALDADKKLHNILRATADDPVMRATQDLFFDDAYWRPAQRAAEVAKISCALGVALVYDSCVHGAWKMLRDRTNARATIDQCGEQTWLQTYVSERRNWLAQHARKDLRGTVYRMEAFQRLIDQSYWELELPLVVRGAEISLTALAATPPHCYEGPPPGARILSLQSPLQRGLDVRLLQLELSDRDIDIVADGVFGPTCMNCIKQYQAHNDLSITGAADAVLIEHLGSRKIIAARAESMSIHDQSNRLEQPARGY